MRLKKTLAAFLAACLCLTLVVAVAHITAQASEFKDDAEIKHNEAVNVMVALNIINGKGDNVFEPKGTVTRAEMAKMICVALNGGKEPTLGSTTIPAFADTVGHWAAAYIEYCADLGIVAGMGDGRFAPQDTVTGSQAAKMMLVALGYDADIEGFKGAKWDTAVNRIANTDKLFESVPVDPNAGLSRDNAAQIVYNGLQAAVVQYAGGEDGKQTVEKTEQSLLNKMFSVLTLEGIMTHISYDGAEEEYTYTFLDSEGQSKQFVTPDDYAGYFGMNCTVKYKQTQEDVYGVYLKESKAVLTLTGWELEDAARSADSSFKYENKTYKTDCQMAQLPVYYYNNWSKMSLSSAISSVYPLEMKLVDHDGDDVIDLAIAYPISVAKVSSVGSDSVSFNTLYGSYISPVKASDLDGELAVGDYVIATPAQYTAKGVAEIQKTEPLRGTLSGFDDGKMTIDGKAYRYASGMSATVTGREEPFALLGDVVVWREYKPVYFPPVQRYEVALVTRYSEGEDGTPRINILLPGASDPIAVRFTNEASGLVGYRKSGDMYTFYRCDTDLAASKIKVNGTVMSTTIVAPPDEPKALSLKDGALQGEAAWFKGFAENAVVFVKHSATYSKDKVEDLTGEYIVVNAYTNSSGEIALAYLDLPTPPPSTSPVW